MKSAKVAEGFMRTFCHGLSKFDANSHALNRVKQTCASSFEVSLEHWVRVFDKNSFLCFVLLAQPPSPTSLIGSFCSDIFSFVSCKDSRSLAKRLHFDLARLGWSKALANSLESWLESCHMLPQRDNHQSSQNIISF